MDVMCPEQIASRIRQRRYQMLVHSYLYYQLGTSIIEDLTFDRWARELVRLQTDFPEIASNVEFHKDFIGFDGTSGYDLPFGLPRIQRIGDNLLEHGGNRQ